MVHRLVTPTASKGHKEKTGSKIKRSNDSSLVLKSRKPRRTVSPTHMLEPIKHPNMSRKPRSNILYVFPTFDKCDSLVFFPNTMTRHLNSGDYLSLLKLFNTHLDKNCEISFCCNYNQMTIPGMVKMFEFMNELHPDTIMCIHNTKVIENEIHSAIYAKFTDCKSLRENLAQTVTDPDLQFMLEGERPDFVKERMHFDERSSEDKSCYTSLIDRDVDMVVYMKISMVMVFDECTKKGMKMTFTAEVTSLKAVEDNF